MSELFTAEQAGNARAWELPNMDGSAPRATAGQLEALQKQAWKEAWDKGEREGRQAGQAELTREAKRFKALADAFGDVREQLDETLERELTELALLVARRVVRRELKTDPELVLTLIREALQAMPMGSRDIQLHMHPDDVRLVQQTLAASDGETRWKAVADPMIERGGLRVSSESSLLDATLEQRIQRIVSRVLGDDRARDGSEDDDLPADDGSGR
ncbi:MAG: flagellar assembly protein FliH [Wenzhouxiangellaceae bacterium]|nr:flagellar assembly protein FliH [Wenzhouxiangellaceae bacterium]